MTEVEYKKNLYVSLVPELLSLVKKLYEHARSIDTDDIGYQSTLNGLYTEASAIGYCIERPFLHACPLCGSPHLDYGWRADKTPLIECNKCRLSLTRNGVADADITSEDGAKLRALWNSMNTKPDTYWEDEALRAIEAVENMKYLGRLRH